MDFKNSNTVAWVAMSIAVLAFVIPFFVSPEKAVPVLSGISNFDQVDAADGFSVDSTTVIDGSGNVTGAGTGAFSGLLTLNAGTLKSSTNSTSTTATSQTLAVADVNGYDTISITPNTGALTLTFFASSSASTWLPTAGDRQDTCFYNATGTAAATITFAAATGIDWEVATSSNEVGTPATIGANEFACFIFIRKPATAAAFDIGALYNPYINAD